jgi:hypothetical protein
MEPLVATETGLVVIFVFGLIVGLMAGLLLREVFPRQRVKPDEYTGEQL